MAPVAHPPITVPNIHIHPRPFPGQTFCPVFPSGAVCGGPFEMRKFFTRLLGAWFLRKGLRRNAGFSRSGKSSYPPLVPIIDQMLDCGTTYVRCDEPKGK